MHILEAGLAPLALLTYSDAQIMSANFRCQQVALPFESGNMIKFYSFAERSFLNKLILNFDFFILPESRLQ